MASTPLPLPISPCPYLFTSDGLYTPTPTPLTIPLPLNTWWSLHTYLYLLTLGVLYTPTPYYLLDETLPSRTRLPAIPGEGTDGQRGNSVRHKIPSRAR